MWGGSVFDLVTTFQRMEGEQERVVGVGTEQINRNPWAQL